MSGLGRFLADQQRRADASMRRAQLAWDNRAPDEDDEDDDLLTPDQALGQARDEWLGTPAHVADWLAKEADTPEGWEPVDVFKLCGSGDPVDAVNTDALTIGQLLAIVMLGDARDTMRATFALRERVAELMRDEIRGRADELLDAQEDKRRRERDEWLLDRAEERAA